MLPIQNMGYALVFNYRQFYKTYGNPDVIDLTNEKVKTTCQR